MMNRLTEQSALLDLAPDPIFARDADRRITFWNDAAEATYGFTARRPLGATQPSCCARSIRSP